VKAVKSKLGARLVDVELSAQEKVTVELTLTRHGKSLAHKRVASFDNSDGVVPLSVPRSVGKGTATLTITLTDTAGNTETLTKTVKIPAKGKPKHG